TRSDDRRSISSSFAVLMERSRPSTLEREMGSIKSRPDGRLPQSPSRRHGRGGVELAPDTAGSAIAARSLAAPAGPSCSSVGGDLEHSGAFEMALHRDRAMASQKVLELRHLLLVEMGIDEP